ncbi:MAG: peptidoglycan-binding protein, partial [Geminicoccaceae bacterium]
SVLIFLAAAAFVVSMKTSTLAQPVEPIATPELSTSSIVAGDRARALYRVRRFASLRAEPRFEVQPHASLSPGEQILVTGKVGDPLWFRVETRDGVSGHVIGSLVRADEDATPIDLALWPDEADGSITLIPVPPFEIRVFEPEALTAEDKRQIQWALIYLDHYDGAVDGQFGRRSFDAIGAFQRSLGDTASGQLTSRQYRTLIQSANGRLSDDAMWTLQDSVVGYRVDYPSRLLPSLEHIVPTSLRVHDGAGRAEMLITVGPDEAGLSDLYQQVSLSGEITYRRLMDRLFVVAGTDDGRRFYHVARAGFNRPIQIRLIYQAGQSPIWERFATVLFNSFGVTTE